jgi:hypothetical protein
VRVLNMLAAGRTRNTAAAWLAHDSLASERSHKTAGTYPRDAECGLPHPIPRSIPVPI